MGSSSLTRNLLHDALHSLWLQHDADEANFSAVTEGLGGFLQFLSGPLCTHESFPAFGAALAAAARI